jgi:hypothetical protein
LIFNQGLYRWRSESEAEKFEQHRLSDFSAFFLVWSGNGNENETGEENMQAVKFKVFVVENYGTAARFAQVAKIQASNLSTIVNGYRAPTESERAKLIAALGQYRYYKFFGKKGFVLREPLEDQKPNWINECPDRTTSPGIQKRVAWPARTTGADRVE